MVPPSTRRRTATLRFALLAGAAALALAACAPAGDATGSQPSSAPASAMTMGSGMGAAATIHIKSFAYNGPDSVLAGAEVTVMNMDTEAHTVTADDGSFDVVVKAGKSVTFTAPKKPGAYSYHCTYHSNMHGSLTVK